MSDPPPASSVPPAAETGSPPSQLADPSTQPFVPDVIPGRARQPFAADVIPDQAGQPFAADVIPGRGGQPFAADVIRGRAGIPGPPGVRGPRGQPGKSGIMSDAEILAELKLACGDVLIDPYNAINLGPNSYDVTLGECYYADPLWPPKNFCPWDAQHVESYWGQVQQAHEVKAEEEAKVLGVKAGDKVIVIPPGSTYLCHTREFIGGRGQVTTMMKTRSGMGRSCLCVCKAAGLGDVGFVSRWTLEINNAGKSNAVLIVGQRIAQVVFFRTGKPTRSYIDGGSYQKADPYDLKALQTAWKPEDMLPKLKRDPP